MSLIKNNLENEKTAQMRCKACDEVIVLSRESPNDPAGELCSVCYYTTLPESLEMFPDKEVDESGLTNEQINEIILAGLKKDEELEKEEKLELEKKYPRKVYPSNLGDLPPSPTHPLIPEKPRVVKVVVDEKTGAETRSSLSGEATTIHEEQPSYFEL